MRLLRSLLVVTVVALIPLTPTAAQADTKGHRDARGDMRSVAYDTTTHQVTESPSTAEPTAKLGDITKVSVAHGSSTVTITMRYRALAKAGFQQVHEAVIASPKGARLVYVVAGPGRWKGKALMTKPNGKKVRCSIGKRIDYGNDKVVVKVPRSCLGRPSVIKVGAATLVGYGSKYYYDDAYTTGGEFTDPFTLSPRIHR